MHLGSRILSGEKAVSLISVLGKLVNLFKHTISHHLQTLKGLTVKAEAKTLFRKQEQISLPWVLAMILGIRYLRYKKQRNEWD